MYYFKIDNMDNLVLLFATNLKTENKVGSLAGDRNVHLCIPPMENDEYWEAS